MLSRIKTTFLLTLFEEWRSRILASVLLFAVAAFYLGLVLTRLAIGFEERFFRDLSFALIEIFGFVFAFVATYRVIVQDVRKDSVFELFRIRGMRPWEYLCGRYLGIVGVVSGAIFLMMSIFMALSIAKGFLVHEVYGVTLGLLCLRLNIIVACAIFLATLTTHQASFLVCVFLVYLSGYANGPLKVILSQPQHQNFLTIFFIKPMTFVLPDFSQVSLDAAVDAFIYGLKSYRWINFAEAFGYSFLFSSLVLIAACLTFRDHNEII